MKTKLFSLFLTLVIGAGTISAEKVQIGAMYYNLNNSTFTASVTYKLYENINGVEYYNRDRVILGVNIPSVITYNEQEYLVTEIGDNAFNSCPLSSVVIPNSITNIRASAFSGCSNITSVTWNAKNCNTGNFGGQVTSFTFGDEVETIPAYCCSGMNKLTSIVIPDSVKNIGNSAFFSCGNIKSVTWNARNCNGYNFGSQVTSFTFGDKVDSIPASLCQGMNQLTSIVIPNSVMSIGNNAFSNCTNLTSVIWNAKNCIKSGNFGQQVESFIFGDDVEIIPEYCCYGMNKLASITIPEGVKSIGNSAFENCTSIISINLPNSITDIGGDAFWGCTQLIAIDIPNSVTNIGDNAFDNCQALTSVTLGSGLTSISHGLFYSCSNLNLITIPDGIQSIGDNAFNSCSSLSNITMPNSVTYIGDEAFAYCISLTSFSFPDSVKSINYRAFEGCTGLTSIIIPDSVTSIKEEAFINCSGLINVTIGENVANIGKDAFIGCENIVSIVWNAKNCKAYTFGHQVTSFIFGSSVEVIPASICLEMNLLTDIIIPQSVTSIEKNAFRSCEGLTTVVIPNNVTYIGNNAFRYCYGLTSVTIGNNVRRIGEYAFDHCENISEIAIPSSIDTIEFRAFRNCENLTMVTLSSNPVVAEARTTGTSLSSLFGTQVEKYIIGNTIDVIGDNAFYGSSKLGEVTCLGENPATLRSNTFGNCNNLSAIYVPCGTLDTYTYAWAEYASKIKYVPTPYTISVEPSDFGLVHIPLTICDSLLTAIANYGYHFSQWSDGNTDNPRMIELTQDTTFTAEFAKNSYSVTTQVNELTWGTASDQTIALYLDNVSVSASPNYGYHFVQWSDGNTDNPRTIVLTQDTMFTAVFAKNIYIITDNSNKEQGSFSGKSQAEYLDEISLTVNSEYGYHFVQWSDGNTDNPRTIVLTQDTTFTAEFAKNTYIITTQPENPEAGTTTGDCSALYLDTIQLSASPNYGYHFDYWSDGNASNPRTITVTEDKTYQAIFAKNVYNISKQCDASQGSISGLSQAEYLDNVELTAIPNYGYHFVQWSDGNTNNPRMIILTNDTTFTAEFEVATSGRCGDNNQLTWKFDAHSNTLSISGHGKLNSNYTFGIQAPTQTERLIIEEGVTSIGNSAFRGCGKINSFALPTSLKSIGEYAFKDLTKIKQINIPNEVETIGAHAFDSCIFVTSIYLGYNVEEIGDYAFKGCIRVNDITSMNTTTPVVYENTLTSISQLAYLYVPIGSKRTYQLDPYWSRFDIREITTEESTIRSDSVIVNANDDNAIFIWPTNDNAGSYTLQVTKDGEVFCTLVFNENGQLIGIAFAPSRDGPATAPAATLSVAGMSFTVTGLNSASKYGYSLTAADDNNNELVTYRGEFATTGYEGEVNPGGEPESGTVTAIDNVNTIQLSGSTKFFRDGQLFIERNGKIYNAHGARVR